MSLNKKTHEEHRYINLIQQDNYYPDHTGKFAIGTLWWPVYKALKDRDFISKLRRNTGPAFPIEHTLDGPVLRKRNKLGDEALSVIALYDAHISSIFDIAEESKIVNSVSLNLGLHRVSIGHDPLTPIGAAGVLAGELANTFMQRVHDAVQSKRFNNRVTTRKRESLSGMSKITRMIDQIALHASMAYAVRIDLSFPSGSTIGFDLISTARHLVSFFDHLENDSGLPVLGYLWWREYLGEVGYRAHTVVILDHEPSAYPAQVASRIGLLWQQQLDGRGIYIDTSRLTTTHRSLGVGHINDLPTRRALLSSLSWLCQRDEFIRLMPHKNIANFGLKKLIDDHMPSATSQVAWSPTPSDPGSIAIPPAISIDASIGETQ